MKNRFKVIAAFCLAVVMSVVAFTYVPQANALVLDYSGYTSRTPTSSYKSGPYYTKLTALSLTGNQANDIVTVAKSQVGYQEGNNSSQRAGTVQGSGNYTEYGYWYGLDANYWCAMFVSWCAYVAGISTNTVKYHSYTETQLSWFRSAGRAYSWSTIKAGGYTPVAGDIVFFVSSSGAASGRTTNHIGIVSSFSNGTLYTVEGNTSSTSFSTNGGCVASKSYARSSTYVVYVCHPNYANAVTYQTGVHEVISSSLNVRSDASTSSTVLGSFTTGERFNVLEVVNTSWGKINYYGQTAYVSIKSDYVKTVADKLGASSNDAITNPTDIVFDTSKMRAWAARGTGNTTVTLENSSEGYVQFTTDGSSDPQAYLLFNDTASFYVDDYNYVSIVARTTSASNVGAKLYMFAGTEVNPNESLTKTFSWQADGEWHEYLLDISDLSGFTGYLNGLRFDYFDGAAASGDSIQLRSIRFLKSASTPTVNVEASTVAYGNDLKITFSGLDSYIDGADYMHPYVAIYADGSYPGNGESVLWNYVYTSGTMNLLSSFQGRYAGQNLPIGNYTVWLTYDTSGRATYISGVHLASAKKCATFSVVNASEYVDFGAGLVTETTVAVVDSGVSAKTAKEDYALVLNASNVTIKDAAGKTVADNATIGTGMVVTADGVSYTIAVEGDLDGDGDADVEDVAIALGGVRGTTSISDAAGDAWSLVSGTTAIDILAVSALLNAILGL